MTMASQRSFAVPAPSLGDATEPERARQLAAKARNGTHAIFAVRLLSVLVTAVSITVLARLIPPEQFGVWAMAGFSLGLMTIVREFGLVSAIVQADTLTPERLAGHFWTSITVSLSSAAVLALAAPFLAWLYGTPLLVPVLWVGCVSLALAGFGLVHAALLRRELRYRRLVVLEGGGMLFGLAVMLVAAFFWRDVWALVAGHVAIAGWISASAMLLCRWTPVRPSRARIDLSLSLQVACYNVLTYAGNNIGLLAGYRFSAAELGFFQRGQQLYHLAHFAFLTPITEVGFALLCQLRSGAAYRAAYIALARRMAVVFLPFAAVLPILSGDLIRTLLGATWAPSSPILAWFAPGVFGSACTALLAQLMISQGRGEELQRWVVADFALKGGGALAGSHFGIVGMAAGFSLATLLLTVPLMAAIAARRGPVGLRDQLVAIWPGVALGAAAVLGAVLGAAESAALDLDPGWRRLVVVGGAATTGWALLCLALRPARDALLGRGLRS
jgi:O-antigen/teichoic acid export membrane protein